MADGLVAPAQPRKSRTKLWVIVGAAAVVVVAAAVVLLVVLLPKSLVVGAVQATPFFDSAMDVSRVVQINLDQMAAPLLDAAERGAHFVAMPEGQTGWMNAIDFYGQSCSAAAGTDTYLDCVKDGVRPFREEVTVGMKCKDLGDARPQQAQMCQYAQQTGMTLLMTLLEQGDGDALYNTAVVLDGKKVAARYRKNHLSGTAPTLSEPDAIEAVVVKVRGRKLGLLNCADAMYSAPLSSLDGVDTIIHVVAWSHLDPFMYAIEFAQGFARGFHVNYVMADLNYIQQGKGGGGVYDYEGNVVSDWWEVGEAGVFLTVGEVPRRKDVAVAAWDGGLEALDAAAAQDVPSTWCYFYGEPIECVPFLAPGLYVGAVAQEVLGRSLRCEAVVRMGDGAAGGFEPFVLFPVFEMDGGEADPATPDAFFWNVCSVSPCHAAVANDNGTVSCEFASDPPFPAFTSAEAVDMKITGDGFEPHGAVSVYGMYGRGDESPKDLDADQLSFYLDAAAGVGEVRVRPDERGLYNTAFIVFTDGA